MSLFTFSILDASCSVFVRSSTLISFGVECTKNWFIVAAAGGS